MNYVVTAHRPTAVTHALVGSFTAPESLNLITVHTSRLVGAPPSSLACGVGHRSIYCADLSAPDSRAVRTVTPEGLVPMVDASLNGRIAYAELFRPPVRGCLRRRARSPGVRLMAQLLLLFLAGC